MDIRNYEEEQMRWLKQLKEKSERHDYNFALSAQYLKQQRFFDRKVAARKHEKEVEELRAEVKWLQENGLEVEEVDKQLKRLQIDFNKTWAEKRTKWIDERGKVQTDIIPSDQIMLCSHNLYSTKFHYNQLWPVPNLPCYNEILYQQIIINFLVAFKVDSEDQLTKAQVDNLLHDIDFAKMRSLGEYFEKQKYQHVNLEKPLDKNSGCRALSLALFGTQDLFLRLKQEICQFLLKKLELRLRLMKNQGRIRNSTLAKQMFDKFSTEIKDSLSYKAPLTPP